MFIDTITVPRPEWEFVTDQARIVADPPEGLIAAIAWDTGDGSVTAVMVWETPGARGDFSADRMMPLLANAPPEAVAGSLTPVDPVTVFFRD